MKMKVNAITARYDTQKKALYQAAEKVFLIPAWEDVQSYLNTGDTAGLESYLEGVATMLEGTPHRGPQVWTPVGSKGILEITTNGGRTITVTEEYVTIDFTRDGQGSTLAAGEVIAHVWASDPGNRLNYNYLKAVVDTGAEYTDVVPLDEYNGAVHPCLGRYAWDPDFRKRFDSGSASWLEGVAK